MARARNIKPGVMANEDLADLAPLTRLLFVYLWMLADRDGRFEDRPKRIRAEALPYDATADVDAMLYDLAKAGFVMRYTHCGVGYVQILNFAKHQRPHTNEAASEIPEYNPELCTLVDSTANHGAKDGDVRANVRRSDSLIDDCLIDDSLIGDTPPTLADASVAPPQAKRKAKPKTALPKNFAISERVQHWAAEHGHGGLLAQHFDSFVSKCQAKGYTYSDWDAALINAIRDDWAKLREARGAPAASRFEQQKQILDQLTGRTPRHDPDDPFTLDAPARLI